MKRGKKYVEAAKADRQRNTLRCRRAVALVKKLQQQNLMRQSKLISEQVVTDVTLISRFVEQLFCHTEQVKSSYLVFAKDAKLKKQKQQELIS